MQSIVEFKDGNWVVTPAESTGGQLSQRGNVSQFEFFGVELGEALAGLFLAGFADLGVSVIVTSIPDVGPIPGNILRAVLLFIAAAVFQTNMIKRSLGAPAANAASLLLAADAITAIFDIRGVIGGLFVGGLGSNRTGRQLGSWVSRSALPGGDRGLTQARNPALDRAAALGV